MGWWSVEEAAADRRCPPWLPNLLERAARARQLITRSRTVSGRLCSLSTRAALGGPAMSVIT